MTTICAISDTHNRHQKLTIPPCTFLIHCGDESFQGTKSETKHFAKWFNKQPAKHKIWTPGNHSRNFKRDYPQSLEWMKVHCPDIHVLINEDVILEGLKLWGSPWTPFFCDWAYNGAVTPSDAAIRRIPYMQDIWRQIPLDTDVLITHGPPRGILDLNQEGYRQGCCHLLQRLQYVEPRVHIFGHLHGSYGHMTVRNTEYYNVSSCDEDYNCVNPVTVIELP